MAPRVIVVGGGCKSSLSHLTRAESGVRPITCTTIVIILCVNDWINNVVLVSGLSAAHTIYLAGGNVVVLDKQGKAILWGLAP